MAQRRRVSNKPTYQQILLMTSLAIIILIGLYLLANRQILQEQFIGESEINQSLLTDDVLQYQSLVENYAQQNGVLSDVNIILAIMRQESNGQVLDVMQSSESAGHPPNYFTSPEDSIAQGVYYYALIKEHVITTFPNEQILTNHQKIQLVLQSYNFGKGFVNYVAENNIFNDNFILRFSQEQDNSCSSEKKQMYGACYGDIYYYQHVERYLDVNDNLKDGTWER